MCESLRPGTTVRDAVNYARVRATKAENLVIVANSRYLSGRYGDGFDKRGHPVRGDLGVVQYELSRHSSLRFEFLQMD